MSSYKLVPIDHYDYERIQNIDPSSMTERDRDAYNEFYHGIRLNWPPVTKTVTFYKTVPAPKISKGISDFMASVDKNTKR